MKMWMFAVALAFAGTLSCQGGGEKSQGQDPDLAAVQRKLLDKMKKAGINVDLKAKTVSIPVVVNQPQDPLEYLLIHRQGKGHEALLVTKVKPSMLNAALGLIGLRPGKNASVKQKEPPPSREDVIERGVDPVIVLPPEGMRFWMTASWKQEEKAVVKPIEDLVIDMTTGLPLEKNDWIYLGGRKAQIYRNEPPVFMADYEGNLVSICYLVPANHLATNRHDRARDEHNWWIAKVCPQPGSELTMTFSLTKPKVFDGRPERIAQMRAEMEKKKAGATIERKPSTGPKRR